MRSRLLLAVTRTVALVVTPNVSAPAVTDATLVRTSAGWLRGAASGDVVRYLGVPYAAAPVGDRRWQAPAIQREVG